MQAILFNDKIIYLLSPRKVTAFNRTHWNADPIVIDLPQPQTPDEFTIHGLHEDLCLMLSTNKLLLAGFNAFQVWAIDLSLETGMEMEITSPK